MLDPTSIMGGAAAKIKSLQREDPNTTWAVLGDLGSGTYGKVHRVRNRGTGVSGMVALDSFSTFHHYFDALMLLTYGHCKLLLLLCYL
jgi:hypothetical protein